jgi:Rap1a immunity proteins
VEAVLSGDYRRKPERLMRREAIVVASLIGFSISNANALSGLELYRACHAKDLDAACMAYIRGVLDGVSAGRALATQNPPIYCPPQEGIPADQGKLIIEKCFNEHPGELQEGAGVLAMAALAKAFPCRQN